MHAPAVRQARSGGGPAARWPIDGAVPHPVLSVGRSVRAAPPPFGGGEHRRCGAVQSCLPSDDCRSLAGSRSRSTSVWHSRGRRVSSIRRTEAAFDTSIAASRSNAAIQRWLSEGTSLQCATDCARVMRGRISRPETGGKNAPVIPYLFLPRALDLRVIFFSEPLETGRIRAVFVRRQKITRCLRAGIPRPVRSRAGGGRPFRTA
jgi:hypothetical protein